MTQYPYVHFTRIDAPTHEALTRVAGTPGTSMSQVIRKALQAYLGTQTESGSVALTTNPPTNTYSAHSASQVQPMSIETYRSILAPFGFDVIESDQGWEFAIVGRCGLETHCQCRTKFNQGAKVYLNLGYHPVLPMAARFLIYIDQAYYWTPLLIDIKTSPDGETYFDRDSLIPLAQAPIKDAKEYPVYPR
jgi:hypothetical protein